MWRGRELVACFVPRGLAPADRGIFWPRIDAMALRVTFSEQSAAPFQKAASFHEAVIVVRKYLEQEPEGEAWIGSTVTSHRITLPTGQGFEAWRAEYEKSGRVEPVRLGMTFGEVVSELGWPDGCGQPMGRSPLSVILRYQPGDVDFHFDQGGRLWLVHRDDLDDPVTILRTA